MAVAQKVSKPKDIPENLRKPVKKGRELKRDRRTAFWFMLPALLSLLAFIFVPIIFSFIMSIYDVPSPTDLADRLLWFYTGLEIEFERDLITNQLTLTYFNWDKQVLIDHFGLQTLFGFFNEPERGIFADRGIYIFIAAIIFLWYIRGVYKVLEKRLKVKPLMLVVISIVTGIIAAPLLIKPRIVRHHLTVFR